MFKTRTAGAGRQEMVRDRGMFVEQCCLKVFFSSRFHECHMLHQVPPLFSTSCFGAGLKATTSDQHSTGPGCFQLPGESFALAATGQRPLSGWAEGDGNAFL